MSVAHSTTIPAAASPARRSSLLRWIGGGTLGATVLSAVAIAAWPASATDEARADGERFGEAVAQLYAADSSAEVDAALTEMDAAVADTRAHAGDAVADQVAAQEDALARAADGFVGSHTSDDAFSVDLYQAELNGAIDDLTSNAEDFRTQGPEVRQAFWEGYETGVSGS
ncbi:MAG TPA: hypothetical protein VN213_02160 [Solirubrobacteraceae bacterium]|nr:hypothetical protein [Solirubrobacteraceae bacterium]